MMRFGLLLWMVCAAAPVLANDWPQWRGPERNEISKETGLLKEWPEGGPKKLWMFENTGLGYSGPAVVGDTLYIMGARDDKEYLMALNVTDGSEKWATAVAPLLTNNWGDGPRGTPTIDGEHVYALTAQGYLVCARTNDGGVVWSAVMKDFGGGTPGWGYCESVLVDGPRVVCTPGGGKGAILALDKANGQPIWQSKDFKEGAQYASITIAELNGKRQYIQLTQKKLVGVDAENGNVLWVASWDQGSTAVIPTPVHQGDYVYITSGYGAGCKLVKIGPDNAVSDVYANKEMKNHHGGVVLIGDHIYGHSDGGGWVCQNFMTGENVWNEKSKLGKGCLTCADGMLYLMEENKAEVVLIEATTAGWNEHGRFTLGPLTTRRKPSGRVWTHPVVANGRLYLRDQDLLSCFDVRNPKVALQAAGK